MDRIDGEQPLCREKTLAICLLMTPLSSAANMRSLHSEASTHNRYRSFVSAPCLTLTGTTGATLCSRRGSHASTFLPPFPRHDSAFRPCRGPTRNGTMATLTPPSLIYDSCLPPYPRTSSCRSLS